MLTLSITAMDLTALLKQEEGFSQSVYKCSEGYNTIGYGHRCGANHHNVTKKEAEKILVNDIAKAMKNVEKLVGKNAPREVKEIVAAMTFQIGYEGVSKFKNMLACINKGDYKGASKEMLNSKWGKQTPARAKRMANLMAAIKK